MKMKHYESDEWSHHSERARTQEQLQEMAGMIRRNCKTERIDDMGDYFCTIYTNEALGLRYWIHDSFGHISEIIEGRSYAA